VAEMAVAISKSAVA